MNYTCEDCAHETYCTIHINDDTDIEPCSSCPCGEDNGCNHSKPCRSFIHK